MYSFISCSGEQQELFCVTGMELRFLSRNCVQSPDVTLTPLTAASSVLLETALATWFKIKLTALCVSLLVANKS